MDDFAGQTRNGKKYCCAHSGQTTESRQQKGPVSKVQVAIWRYKRPKYVKSQNIFAAASFVSVPFATVSLCAVICSQEMVVCLEFALS